MRVTAIIRTPADLGASGAPSDVTFMGTGSLFVTAAFYHRFAGSVGNMAGVSFHLDRGLAGLPAFRAEVKRLTGGRAQFELGSDDATAAAAAERGTSLQALALLLFGIIVALALLVIVGQSVARLALTAADDFPVLRALGCSRAQLAAVALAPGALVATAGMTLAIPAAYALSVFTPIGLARRAEISPGFSFDTPVLLGGAVLLTLLLTARTALTAQRVAWKQSGHGGGAGPGLTHRALDGPPGVPGPAPWRASASRSSLGATAPRSRSAPRSWAPCWRSPRSWPRWCSGPASPTSSATPGWPAGTGT